MKTRNQFVTMALVAILGIVAGLTACNDKPTETHTCNCEQTYGTTAHLGIGETCQCPAPKPCGCTVKEYGTIGTIPIYREKTVTDEQATTAAANIKAGYANTGETWRNRIANKVSAVHISEYETSDCIEDNGKFIIKLGYNWDSAVVKEELEYYASNDLAGS